MVNGFMGWRGGRAGLINGSLLYGPPALVGPGWTNGGHTGGVCSIWAGQFKELLGLVFFLDKTQ